MRTYIFIINGIYLFFGLYASLALFLKFDIELLIGVLLIIITALSNIIYAKNQKK